MSESVQHDEQGSSLHAEGLMYLSLHTKENVLGFILYDADFIHLISICLVTKHSC